MLKFESSTIKTVGEDRFSSYEFFTIYKTKLGGNGEVHHGDHNGSIVIKSTIHDEVTIKKVVLKFESSMIKTVGEDSC